MLSGTLSHTEVHRSRLELILYFEIFSTSFISTLIISHACHSVVRAVKMFDWTHSMISVQSHESIAIQI